MPATIHNGPPPDVNLVDGTLTGTEDIAIEPAIPLPCCHIRILGIETNQIRLLARCQPRNRAIQRLGTAGQRGPVKCNPGRFTFPHRRDVPSAQGQALTVFELPQFAGRRNLDIRVGTDTEHAARSEKLRQPERAIAEIRFGNGAEASDRAALCDSTHFVLGEMGRMDQAPTPIDIDMIIQPIHGSTARPSEAIFHFTHLLGDMDMDWPVAITGDQGLQFFRRHGAQGMGCHAEPAARVPRQGTTSPGHQLFEAVEVIEKAPLPVCGGLPAEAAMGIKDWQQRQTDPGFAGRSNNALGQFGAVGIGLAVALVMQVVKLPDSGEAGLEHFHEGIGGNRFDILRLK